jgi:hypothetical protein
VSQRGLTMADGVSVIVERAKHLYFTDYSLVIAAAQ